MRLMPALVATIIISTPAFAVEQMEPKQVLAGQAAGELVLIDIRTPAEWADTGVATGAVQLDMTSADFVASVSKVMSENPNKKLAFICQSGGRSGSLTSQMEASGITNTINVTGGTSQWIADGLPITKP